MFLESKRKVLAIAGLFIGLHTANAKPAIPQTEQLQLPQCLAAKLTSPYKTLAENKQFKIIDIASDDIDSLAELADNVGCGRFVNLSHQFKANQKPEKQAMALLNKAKPRRAALVTKYGLNHEEEVNAAIRKVNEQNIWDTLTHLTSYYNRSATAQTGVDTAEWLKDKFDRMALSYGRKDVESYFVETGPWYIQPSLVTVIGKDLEGPAVVVGAHMDTLGGRMPGAGDDGSGSASVMEAVRVIFDSGVALKRPVYFIWYAAEERGLVGSQYVVDDFMKKMIPVKAAIQFDMTGFRNDQNDPTMWVFRDYTDWELSDFVAQLIEDYIKVPVDYSYCGYGCSDHASWGEIGVPAAFPCETSFERHNPYIHTSSDKMDLLNGEHMTNFSKLAVAFVIELANE
jgi:leucyl aminopeptidase